MGLISFFIISADFLLKLSPLSSIQIGLPDFWISIFLVWFFIGHFLYLTEFFEGKEIYNIEFLLRTVFITGVVAVAAYFGLEYLPWLLLILKEGFENVDEQAIQTINPVFRHSIQLLHLYFFVVYYLIALVLFKKLIYVKKTKQEIILWNIFKGLLLAAPIFGFTNFRIPEYIIYGYLSISFTLILFLSVRIKWIAVLNMSEKWKIIVLIVFINCVSVVLAVKQWQMIQDNLLNLEIIRNVFLIIVVGMVNLYGVVALLGLIFNLPIAAVMEERSEQINSFQEINQIIQGKFKSEKVFEKLFNIGFSNTKAEVGWIEILNEGEEGDIYSNIDIDYSVVDGFNQALIEYAPAMANYNYIHIMNLKKEPKFDLVRSNFRSMLYFPITANKKLIGRYYLLKTYKNGFDTYMIRLVKTFIDQTSLAIENSELLERSFETERVKEELAIAKSVQKRLLPQSIPNNAIFDISCYSESAQDVGGDFYDYNSSDDKRFSLIIGDVSGKGTTAAFHMAEMKGIFEALIQLNLTSGDFLIRANNAVNKCLESNAFITLSYFQIYSKSRKITYSRAGHCPILYFNAKKEEFKYLDDDGIALGIIKDDSFKDHVQVNEIKFAAGDCMILYTDGIIENRHVRKNDNKSDEIEEYGYERLLKCALKHKAGSPEKMSRAILDDLEKFVFKNEDKKVKSKKTKNVESERRIALFDDITLVVLKFK